MRMSDLRLGRPAGLVAALLECEVRQVARRPSDAVT